MLGRLFQAKNVTFSRQTQVVRTVPDIAMCLSNMTEILSRSTALYLIEPMSIKELPHNPRNMMIIVRMIRALSVVRVRSSSWLTSFAPEILAWRLSKSTLNIVTSEKLQL